jgi:thioredoxin-like negative regulator of GroEL
MKLRMLLWILLLSGAQISSAAGGAWLTSYTNALQVAKEQQKPVLVEFTADWCHYCKVMEKGTLQEATTLAAMQAYVPLRLDYDKETELVRRFGIQGIPAFLILSESGDEAARTSGAQPAAEFAKWLKESEEAVRKQNDLRERMAVERRQLDAAFSGQDEKALKQAAETLYQWAGMEKMETKNLARDYLVRLAEVRPALVLDGANNTSLAVRIASVNALQRKYGAEFDLDPWAEAANRQKAVAAWRVRIASGK